MRLFSLVIVAAIIVPGWSMAQTASKPAVVSNVSSTVDKGVEGRIEQFIYHPNRVFHIRSRAGSFTNIEVPPDETIEGFYLSDTTFWRFVVAKDQSRVLVKPGEPGVTNSGTLVTNKRVYELSFRSVPDGEPWHQRVQWEKTKEETLAWGVFEPLFSETSVKSSPSHQPQVSEQEVVIDAARVNFRWRILGDAPFRPSVVFDDGKFIYIRMPDVQDYPAIFVEDAGKMRVVDYVVKNGIIIIHRISDAVIMRLENQVVRVERHGVQ